MASIIQGLQKDALNPNFKISDLLRKAYVIAKKLNLTEFESWITKELNGYLEKDDFPEYRYLRGEIKALDMFGRLLPVIIPNAEIAERLSKRATLQSIAEIESVIESEEEGSFIAMPYPKDFELKIMRSAKADSPPRFHVQKTQLIGILDTVKNIVLKWAVKLEADGIIGNDISFTSQERDVAQNSHYTVNNFYAPVSHSQIQQNTSHSEQIMNLNQVDLEKIIHFIEKLKTSTKELNLSDEKKAELNSEIQTIEAQTKSPKPKTRIIKESLLSLKRILEGAAGGALGNSLLELLGNLLI